MNQTCRRMQVVILSFILTSVVPSFAQVRVARLSHEPLVHQPDDRSLVMPETFSSPQEVDQVIKAPIRNLGYPNTRYMVDATTVDRFVLVDELDQRWSVDSLAWLNYYHHTSTYDAQGYPMNRLTELWFDGAWHNRERSLYTADSIGNVTSHRYQIWWRNEYFEEDWLDQWKHVYTYDAERRIVGDEYQVPGGNQTWNPATRFIYQFDPSGNMLNFREQVWADRRWNDMKLNTFTYSKGHLVRELEQKIDSMGRWRNDLQTVYTYDVNNLLEKVWMYWDGAFWNDKGRILYNNDDRGNIVEAIRQNIYYGMWENYIRYLYAYDQMGNIIESVTQMWGGDRGWINSWRFSETFRPDGKNLSSKLEQWNETQWVNNWETRRTYDSDGNCTKEEYFLWYSGWMDYRRIFYTWQRVTDVQEDGNVPSQFYLGQNYPNPFNPFTIFDFQSPIASRVRLTVYDVLGREIAILVDEVKQPGKYTVRWDARQKDGGQASNMPSGVYFYKMTAGEFRDVKKMILLR